MFLYTGGVHSFITMHTFIYPELGLALLSIIPLIPLVKTNEPDDYLNQMMVGLMLGDGTLVKKYAGGSTYFKFAQSVINVEYLQHVFNLFKQAGHVNMEAPSEGKSTIKGKTYTPLGGRTNLLLALFLNGIVSMPYGT